MAHTRIIVYILMYQTTIIRDTDKAHVIKHTSNRNKCACPIKYEWTGSDNNEKSQAGNSHYNT